MIVGVAGSGAAPGQPRRKLTVTRGRACFAAACFSLLLFHGLAGFLGALGADFGTLLALLVHDLLAAENLDERLSPPSPLRKPVE